MQKQTFDHSKSVEAQREFCKEKGYPHFAPSNGICYNCRKDIYTQIDHGTFKSGLSYERASSELITGCPHCHRSYCD